MSGLGKLICSRPIVPAKNAPINLECRFDRRTTGNIVFYFFIIQVGLAAFNFDLNPSKVIAKSML